MISLSFNSFTFSGRSSLSMIRQKSKKLLLIIGYSVKVHSNFGIVRGFQSYKELVNDFVLELSAKISPFKF